MKTLKKIFSILFSVIILCSSMSTFVYAAPSVKVDEAEKITVGEITRDQYIKILAKAKNITEEEADQLERAESGIGTLAYDEVQKYKNVEKVAYTIKDNHGYTQQVKIVVTIRYIYNRALGRAVTIEEVLAPYAYMPGISTDDMTFDHGNYAIQMNGTTSAWVFTNGSFVYKSRGVSVSVGGDIVSVSWQVLWYKVTTKAIRIGATFYLSDL